MRADQMFSPETQYSVLASTDVIQTLMCHITPRVVVKKALQLNPLCKTGLKCATSIQDL